MKHEERIPDDQQNGAQDEFAAGDGARVVREAIEQTKAAEVDWALRWPPREGSESGDRA